MIEGVAIEIGPPRHRGARVNGGIWIAAASVSIVVHLGALAVGLALRPGGGEAILYIDLTAAVPAPPAPESPRARETVRPRRGPALARARATPPGEGGAPRSEPVGGERIAEQGPERLREPRAGEAETEASRPVDHPPSPPPTSSRPEPRVVTSETPAPAEGDASPVNPTPAARAAASPVAAAGGQRGQPGTSATGGDRQSVAAVTWGSGQAGDADYAKYYGLLLRRIREALAYPSSARRRNVSGTVELEIVIHPDGAIGEVTVVASSSHPVLDEAAVDAARSLRPLPFPAGLRPRTLRARLPVVFELR
jgi:periplasmic protein TonB